MQKNTKKKLFVVAVAVCLIAILSFSTLAWFSDSHSVENEFHMAGDADTPEEIFSIGVWEPVDEDGNGIIDEDEKKDGEEYYDILPGGKYPKQPHVENTGSYDAYIRMSVTVTNADAWIAALNNKLGGANGYDLANLFLGHDETKWTRYEEGKYDANANTYTMTFYYNDILIPGAEAYLFTHVQIPGELTQNDMVYLGGTFNINVKADAVQTLNLGDGVDTAYEAFAVVEATQDLNQIPDPT